MRFDETCQSSWAARSLGLCVLLGVVAAMLWLAFDGGAPRWTWLLLAFFGVVSALASVANFGDRWHLDDEAITYRNVLTARLGLARERRVPWSEVERASEYEGRTWFLTVTGGPRMVLDQLREHDRLDLVFRELGIPVGKVEKPRLWRRGGAQDPHRGPH